MLRRLRTDSTNLGERQQLVRWRLRDLALVSILAFLLAVGSAALVNWATDTGWLGARVARALLFPLSPILLGLACLTYVAVRFPGTTRLLFGTSPPTWRDAGLGFGFGSLAFLVQGVVGAALAWLTGVSVQELQPPLREAALDAQLRPFLIVAAVLLAPLAEELFFRGMVYQVLRDKLGVGGGMLISALFFAAVHLDPGVPSSGNFVVITVISLLGLALAWLFEVRRTLVAPITMHATVNLLSTVALVLHGSG